jgi:two-component system, NarL family, sensor histidine kinase FusK
MLPDDEHLLSAARSTLRRQLSAAMAMENGKRQRAVLRYLLKVSLVFVAYVAAGELGLFMPFTSGNVSPVWPASGIALSAVLRWGYNMWPGIALAAFLINFLSPIPAQAAVGIALGNTSGAVVGAYLLRRILREPLCISKLRDVLALVAAGALSSTVVSASIGTTTLFLRGVHAWSDFGTAWRVWWFGDAMGVLVATPLILAAGDLGNSRKPSREFLLLLIGTAVTSLAVFSHIMGVAVREDVLAFAVFPFVIWAAIRFESAGAAVICFMIAAIAVWGTAQGFGPFIEHTPVRNAVLLQLFLAVISITGLMLAAVISERTQAEYALRKLSGRLLRLQDEERRRLGRDLHDSAGQMMAALQMNLAALRHRFGAMEQKSSDLLADTMEIADRVIKEIRTVSYLLHPPLLEEAGLASAVRWYVEGLAQRSHLKIDLKLSPTLGRLSPDLEIAIFRIVQESLINVHRHSGSSSANIYIGIERNQVFLRVQDCGKGIPSEFLDLATSTPAGLGVGIRGIAERVRELGGSLSIRRMSPGTSVEVTLPLVRPDRKDHGGGAAVGARAQG